jgi:hypothetical protein
VETFRTSVRLAQMFCWMINKIRRHTLAIFMAHVLFAAFSPLLHAHSVTPAGHVDRFHAHLSALSESSVCESTGAAQVTLTAEVCEGSIKNGLESAVGSDGVGHLAGFLRLTVPELGALLTPPSGSAPPPPKFLSHIAAQPRAP